MQYLMGVDLGTSATKTVLFDENCRAVASASAEYPMAQPQNGWAEQDPADWVKAALHSIRSVLQKAGVDAAQVKGIGLSGQMHGLVMLDKHNEVIRPAILWCDQRSGAQCATLTEKVGRERLLQITANPATTGFTAAKILWVQENEPANWARCRHILLPKDYLRFVLTGAFATEVSDASGMQLLDVPRRCWSAEILDRLGIDAALLPPVYESPEVTGRVLPGVAQRADLAAGTPVVGGAGDNAAAAIGTGVVTQGRAFTTLGTSGVVYAHTQQPRIDPQGRVHTFCCAVPGCWHVMGVTQAAGLSLRWFRDSFCQHEVEVARCMGVDPYFLMDKEAALSPIGANRLLYLPYLMGERTPHLDPNCRGAFIGLSAVHQKRDLLRAVLEGVAYSQRESYDILREMGVQIQAMMACGGGGSSPLWRQMLADLYDCPMYTVQSEGPALGVAILAGVGVGLFPSVQEACSRFVQPQQACAPVPENVPVYETYYRVYRQLYPALRDSYRALQGLA